MVLRGLKVAGPRMAYKLFCIGFDCLTPRPWPNYGNYKDNQIRQKGEDTYLILFSRDFTWEYINRAETLGKIEKSKKRTCFSESFFWPFSPFSSYKSGIPPQLGSANTALPLLLRWFLGSSRSFLLHLPTDSLAPVLPCFSHNSAECIPLSHQEDLIWCQVHFELLNYQNCKESL